MRTWKIVVALLGFWLVIMMYMSTTIFQNTDNSHRMERQLQHAMKELERLRKQNEELHQLAIEMKDINLSPYLSKDETVRKLQKRLHKANQELQRLSQIKSSSKISEPSLQHEVLSRKVENDMTEFWYYMQSELKQIQELAMGSTLIINKVREVLSKGTEYKRTLLNDTWFLQSVDNLAEWRKAESLALGDLVQRRLKYLQNPKDCSSAKKLVCNLSKGCGYGCQLHHVTYCIIVAYATERTFILESKGWRYATHGWKTVFQPVSDTCTDRSGSSIRSWGASGTIKNVQVVEMPIIDNLYPKPNFIPLAIPEDLAPRLLRLHGDPAVWWIGQFVRYLVRPQPHLQEHLEKTKKELNFHGPIVGVHVRRTDKVGTEAAYHDLEEYMSYVDDYYKQLEAFRPVTQRQIYLASDDPSVLTDARNKYPSYNFIFDTEISKTAGLGTRYSDASLRGIIADIHFLSLCDYLVCTFSSQVCRVAYELMQTYHGDASRYFHSLDDIYYFGGQNAHNVMAIQQHKAERKEEISLEEGDLVGIAGNHWNGYSKGINRRLGKSGLFPSYKTVNKVEIAKFPTYPEVPITKGR